MVKTMIAIIVVGKAATFICDGADTCRSNGGYPEKECRDADDRKQRYFSGFHAYCCYGFCPELKLDEAPVTGM